MSKLYNTKFKPTKKGIVQAAVDYVIKKIPRKKKVSPDIKSVKPTKDVKGSVKRTKSDEYVKRITTLDKADLKVKTGKQMMREGQKERKKMVDTGRAFQFKHSKSYHAIQPGDKPEVKYKGNVRKQKKGGGMMGRRFGYKDGSKKSSLGMQSVKYGLDNNPDVTKADPKAKFIAAANKKKKKVV